jgi:histidinol-phosphatase (PHP family)
MAAPSLSAPVLYESHMHTPLCKHATGLPEDYARVALRRGLKGIIVTCHNPIPGGWGNNVRMDISEFDTYIELVDVGRQRMEGKCDVRLGLETDFVPGMEKDIEALHARATFHHILGSVHPQTRDYHARFYTGDAVEYQKLYFTHLAMAAETKLFDTISHPDLVKNLFPSRWDPFLVLDHIRSSLDRIAKTGCAMELNTSGLYKDIQEMNPGPIVLKEICARNIPVVLGGDAHAPVRAGDQFPRALRDMKAIGFKTVNIFLDRKRQEIPIDVALASVRD